MSYTTFGYSANAFGVGVGITQILVFVLGVTLILAIFLYQHVGIGNAKS